VELKSEEGFLLIGGDKLKEGKNEIAVWYRNKYNNDGSGCVSFVDVDTKQYLYTQFEPYYANRVFPLFDQPDLKAKMRLSVLCPKDWKKVISNEHAVVDMKAFNSE
jgi:aminopeptidase N